MTGNVKKQAIWEACCLLWPNIGLRSKTARKLYQNRAGTVSSVALRVEEADVYSYVKRNMVAPT